MYKSLRKKIEKKAKSLGFDLVAFTSAKVPKEDVLAYKKWLKNNFNADLKYMEDSRLRENTNSVLSESKSVIVLATNYKRKKSSGEVAGLKIAKYAQIRDYHKFLKKRLYELEEYICSLDPKIKTRNFVDTAPVLERAFCKKANIGFIGKNSCLITKEFGSYVFLSGILLNKEIHSKIDSQKNTIKDFSICGSCTLCINSCPTKAIISPGVIDARRCIAYHTIESKEEIPEGLKEGIKKSNYLFGCDICQEVCPHNATSKFSKNEEITTSVIDEAISLDKLVKIKSEEDFVKTFQKTPVMRAKLKGIKRIIKLHKKK